MIKGITVSSLILSLATAFIVGCSRDPDPSAKAATSDAKDVKILKDTIPHDSSDDQFASSTSPSDLAAKADVPLYPGADAPDGMSNVRKTGTETRYEIILSTTDSEEKVYAFYRQNLKTPEEVGGGKNLMGMTPNGNYASVTAVRREGKTEVTIVVNSEKSASGNGGAPGG